MKLFVLSALLVAVSADQTFLNQLSANGNVGYDRLGLSAPIATNGIGLSSGAITTGRSESHRAEDGIGNYRYSYVIKSNTGSNSAQESGDVYGRKRGSYSLGVIDGRQRVLDYVADELGFRASIRTNEPGTAPLSPADTILVAPDTTGIAQATNQAAAGTLNSLLASPTVDYLNLGIGARSLDGQARPLLGLGNLGLTSASNSLLASSRLGLGSGFALQNQGLGLGYGNALSLANKGLGLGLGGVGLAVQNVAVQQPIATPIAAQLPVQETIVNVPRPSAFSTQISHITPQAVAPLPLSTGSLQYSSQPIVQQPFVDPTIALPRPTSYSIGVSHLAPAAAINSLPPYKQESLAVLRGSVKGY